MSEPAISLIDENGFLAGRIDDWIDSQRQSLKAIYDRAHGLNRDCHHFISGRAIHVENAREVVPCLLFTRLLELYQSIIVVSERGMDAATRILHRAFIEGTFQFFAIQRDPTYLDIYLDQFLIQKRKVLLRIRQSNSSVLDNLRQAATDEVLEETERAIKNAGARAISTEDVAKRAKMHNSYLTAYAVLSHAVHTGVSDVEHHVHFDNVTNETVGFRYGPSSTETRRAICLCGLGLADALAEVSRNFGEDRTAMWEDHKKAFESHLEVKAEDK